MAALIAWTLCWISWLVSAACLYTLWTRPCRLGRRLAWSVVLPVPVFGPLFFAAFARPPSVQPEWMQTKFDVTRHSI